jgi:hypothetical protein
MTENTEAVNEVQDDVQPPAAAINGIKSLKGTPLKQLQSCQHYHYPADEGFDIFVANQDRHFTDEESRRVARKLDWHLLPCMCVFYGLNYVDKVIMGWAVLFTFKEDLGLVGNQYSWASSVFYFGYLAAQYPANFLLQRFGIESSCLWDAHLGRNYCAVYGVL